MNSPFYSSVPDGKSHIVGCEIKIDGKKVLTESGTYTLHIHQKTCNHSTFTLNCRADAFESSREFPLTNSKHLFGKKNIYLAQAILRSNLYLSRDYYRA